MYYYALVLKKTVNIHVETDEAIELMDRYEKNINYFQSKYENIQVEPTYEIVHKNNGKINLHLHAMVKSDMPYTLIAPPRERGMSTYFEECNPLAWDVYMSKDPFTRYDVIEYIDTQNQCYDPYSVFTISHEKHVNKVLMSKMRTIRLV